MSLIFATQLSAVATLALAILALATAIFAGLAFRTQYRQLQDQHRQIQDQLQESNRQALERRRAQAVQVFMWSTSDANGPYFHVRNTSQQPIYDLQLDWHVPPQPPYLEEAGSDWRDEPLMPGEEFKRRSGRVRRPR